MVKRKLDQVVYEHIIQKIDIGELLQRQHITEQGIADELKVSRTPVRKAFERLVGEDYLENIENVGVHVKIRSLNSKGFQDRVNFIERLSNHYLFDVEKDEVVFEVDKLREITETMKSVLKDEENTFEDYILKYFQGLLIYSENNYSKQTILKSLRELLFNEGYIFQIIKDSRELTMKHLMELMNHLEVNNYASARREVRILFNQLKLDVIENNKKYE